MTLNIFIKRLDVKRVDKSMVYIKDKVCTKIFHSYRGYLLESMPSIYIDELRSLIKDL